MRSEEINKKIKAKKTLYYIPVNQTSHSSRHIRQSSQAISWSNKNDSHLRYDGNKSQLTNIPVTKVSTTIVKKDNTTDKDLC